MGDLSSFCFIVLFNRSLSVSIPVTVQMLNGVRSDVQDVAMRDFNVRPFNVRNRISFIGSVVLRCGRRVRCRARAGWPSA
jgi:hypothetical protein